MPTITSAKPPRSKAQSMNNLIDFSASFRAVANTALTMLAIRLMPRPCPNKTLPKNERLPTKRIANLALSEATLARLPTMSLARPHPVDLSAGVQPFQTASAPARRAHFAPRHLGLLISFFLLVAAPGGLTGWYLWARAADQFASTLGFSVRKENVSSAVELLGGFTNITGASSADTDILYDYMHSQKLVAEIDADLDLRTLWSKPPNDPVFAYTAPGSIETLMSYWASKVQVTYDNATRQGFLTSQPQ